ncbi:MAG TPA: hypothetical protein PKO09_08960 [Anaerolineae bacterium]|nr:hypothetical protein [Anaerolineae bacterium]
MHLPWGSLLALVATLLPLLWVRRWITLHVQELSMRWIGDPDVALVLYFVLVLPGVVIHELSHLLMAVLLRVRVRRFSLGPVRRARGGRVSLGSIEVARVDPVRGSLIGVAPLLAGSAVILLIGNRVLGITEWAAAFQSTDLAGIAAGLRAIARVPDFWLWLYLIFAVSNSMLPSESDMQFVRPVLIFLGIALVVVLIITGLPAIPEAAGEWVGRGVGYLASAFGLTLGVDLLFVVLLGLLLGLTRRAQGQ